MTLKEIKKKLESYISYAEEGSEDYNESIDRLAKLESLEQGEQKLGLEAKRLELEELKFYAENAKDLEKISADKLRAWLEFAGKGLFIVGSIVLASIIEKGKEEGKILKTNEFMNTAMNLIKKA